MFSMIDTHSRMPIFQQIAERVKEMIRSDILVPGDKLPSVRGLTSETGINPNTIQKAYDELTSMGLIEPSAGKGMFVTKNAKEILYAEAKSRLPELTALAKDLAAAGVSPEEILNAVKDAVK